MSNIVNHPQQSDKLEIKNIYNTLPETLLESFSRRAMKDAKKVINNSGNNLKEEDLEDVMFVVYRAYILGAVLERSSKNDIEVEDEYDENAPIKRSIQKTNIPNVVKLNVTK